MEGGLLAVASGWRHGIPIDEGARWDPAEVGPAARKLIADAPPLEPVYGAGKGHFLTAPQVPTRVPKDHPYPKGSDPKGGPVLSVLRLNFVLPAIAPKVLSAHYKAGIEMAKYADDNNFFTISFEEHHGADDGWSPTPLTNAALVAGVTKNVRLIVQALLVPLHDPIRLAEQIAVLDLASGGRLSVVAGLGYRPAEYEAAGKSWKDRGRILDESLTAILAAWKGEPFEYAGRRARVTPVPMSPAQALLFVGGSGKPGARRAARFNLPFLPAANLPDLEAYYNDYCAEQGVTPFIMMPPKGTAMLHIADDPDKAWAELGHYFLHEATTYASWQTPDIHSAVHSHATTAEELRTEGIYQVLSPEQCIERARAQGVYATSVLHPMVGGMPPENGWESLQLYVDKVLPGPPR